jgi:hypothetical protein
MEKDKAEFSVGLVEYQLMYLMGEDNYTKYKEQVCSKDKNKTLTVADLIKGLTQCMSQSFYEEFMEKITLVEIKMNKTHKDSPKLKEYYIKCVQRLFELFGKGMNAEKSSHLYKIFKLFNETIEIFIESIFSKDLDYSNPSLDERLFIFNVQVALIQVMFTKFPFDSKWDLKTWDDINSRDIQWAAEEVFKQFLNIEEKSSDYKKSTVH